MVSFRIAASTAIGQGPFSEEILFQTSPECKGKIWSKRLYQLNLALFVVPTVPSPPQYLQSILTRDTVVQLSWLPPSSPNGNLIGYQVIYTAHGQSEVCNIYINKCHNLEKLVLKIFCSRNVHVSLVSEHSADPKIVHCEFDYN